MEVLDGYIRVSQVRGRQGPRFISPTHQREQIEAGVRSHGARLGELFEELDQSGARADRPLLNRAIERIECGHSAGLVVAKLDRFGRSVIDGLRAIQRIERAGGTFVSVGDGLDLGTATGRLVLQVLFSIGEWELGRVRGSWNVARKRAIARGVYVAGEPIGYRKGPDGRLRIDPEEAALVREVFECRAAGHPYREIASRLNRSGARTRRGARFRHQTLSKIVSNPAYRGEAHHGEHRNPAAHDPIVDRALWQLCQQTPGRRRRDDDRSLLGGLARCGSCGRMMGVQPLPRDGAPRSHAYSCEMPDALCSASAYARAEELEPLIEELLFGRRWLTTAGLAEQRERECEAEVKAAEQELIAYRDDPAILAALGANSFAAGLEARRQRFEQALAGLGRIRRGQPSSDQLAALATDWPELACAQRRTALARFVECVVIGPGRAPVYERTKVFGPGEAPVSQRRRRLVICAESLAKGGERPLPPRPWSPRRIEAELRDFLRGRREWPCYREFAEAGRARLFAHALAYGGPHYWGPRLGVCVPPFCVSWNRERVRAALAPLLGGREKWPGEKVFEQVGMLAVYRAAQRHGGLPYWAERFGCSYDNARALKWPEQRIAAELCEFTSGRPGFPTKSEFERAGKGSLYEAICRRGGVAQWAERFEAPDAA